MDTTENNLEDNGTAPIRGVHGGGGRLLLVFQALPLGVHLLVLGGRGLFLVEGGQVLLVASSLFRGFQVGLPALFYGLPILKRGTSKDEVNCAGLRTDGAV